MNGSRSKSQKSQNHAEVFASTARAVAAYKSEVTDKKALMTPDAFRRWERFQSGHARLQHLARPLGQVAKARADLETLKDGNPDNEYFIGIADDLYRNLAAHARLGWSVVQVGTDIRRMPPMTTEHAPSQERPRLAVPLIQSGLDRLVEVGYLPEVHVRHTGAQTEPYYWAITRQLATEL
jgi:hypothetical protein